MNEKNCIPKIQTMINFERKEKKFILQGDLSAEES